MAVQKFFEKYRYALATFSAEEIAAFYQAPVAIYSDSGIQFVSKESDTLAFWKEGVKHYKEKSIATVTFTVLMEEQLSEKNFVSKVLWTNYDKSGKEVASETNFYILTGKDDKLKISGLILMNSK